RPAGSRARVTDVGSSAVTSTSGHVPERAVQHRLLRLAGVSPAPVRRPHPYRMPYARAKIEHRYGRGVLFSSLPGLWVRGSASSALMVPGVASVMVSMTVACLLSGWQVACMSNATAMASRWWPGAWASGDHSHVREWPPRHT